MESRRKFERVPVSAPVTVFWSSGEAVGELRNLSVGGVLIRLGDGRTPGQGAALEIEFTVPGTRMSVRRAARVRWSMQQSGLLFGAELDRPLELAVVAAMADASTRNQSV